MGQLLPPLLVPYASTWTAWEGIPWPVHWICWYTPLNLWSCLLADHAQFKEGNRPILLGRVDYRVRAVHQDTAVELFNVSYSQISLLDSSLKLPTFGDTHALDEATEAEQLGIALDPETKNAIHRIDPKTNKQLWSRSFEQPPVTIFAGGERGQCLYGGPTWPAADGIATR